MVRTVIDWSGEDRLGKMADSELAKILGVSRQAVSQGRSKQGIPAYKPDSPILKGEVGEPKEVQAENEVLTGQVEDIANPAVSKEERRMKARREASKATGTLEGTLKAADPSEVEAARAIVADMLSDAAVAVALGTTKFTVPRYIREKKLHAVKIGGVWKIPAEALKRFLSGE